MRRLLAVLPTLAVVTLVLSACGMFGGSSSSRTDSGSTIEETGQHNPENPLGALRGLAEAGEKMAAKAKEMENRKPVDPVKFDVLIGLMPDPSGWTGDEAKGATSAMGEFKVSNASRSYKKGDSRIQVEIVDGGFVPMIYAPFAMMTSFSTETSDGHAKGVTIDGFPAFEEWKKKDKDAKIVALVNDRFLITIEGDNVDPETVREWTGYIDLKKVAKLQ